MISPEGFRELRKSVPLSRRACAEFLGCSVSTVRAWDRGRNRVPWSAVRLLRLLRQGDLGALHASWNGWQLQGDRLISPESHAFRVFDMAWWSLTCRQAEGFRQAFDRWQRLSEAPGVAGVSPAADALEPATEPESPTVAVGLEGGPLLSLPAEPALLVVGDDLSRSSAALGRAACSSEHERAGEGVVAGLVSSTTSDTPKGEIQPRRGFQRVPAGGAGHA